MSARRYHALRAASTIVLAALVLFGQHPAQAQQLLLTPSRSLDFGSFVVTSAGTVTLLPNGERRSSGGVILLNSSLGQAASVNVRRNNSGAKDKGAIISLPTNGSVRLSSGASSMALNDFNSNPPAPTMASVPAVGTDLAIGATLVVTPNQPAGRYTGTFIVSVN
ncbi:DUF4402 domain-containing protein [Massilia sp. IC2-476]|uniref:DUF4402 domain-containing protein n=1 Tax=Massilia sp. IC2-476 TaxID=2887199 RepID=UPI001D11D746|nr:DUF4402 domain-containing protein [Massilia sp. IC2-476]MCC2971194.1 DUF4402 domain-containing protein [Massilia sp. IC2-476]